jgi:hypothetical protein
MCSPRKVGRQITGFKRTTNIKGPGKKEGEDVYSAFFVFCSKQKPAVIDQDGSGKWDADLLEPGNSNAIWGITMYTNVLYWAACHEVNIGMNGPIKDWDKLEPLAHKLGYRFTTHDVSDEEQASLKEKLDNPFDSLKW